MDVIITHVSRLQIADVVDSPCSPTSSNCVIWGGPDLQCINLCKGDNITDVIEKIALEICTILDTLNITAYDLTCFNLANCSPQNFTDLINFLIVKVCELDNASTSTEGGTTPPVPSSGCPTDCFVDVASCFVTGGVTTMNLTNYVTTIGTRICTLVTTITLQQNQIDNLNVRVTDLETTPPPSYTTPTMVMAYELPSVPSLAAGSTQPINVVIDSYVNQIWFPFVAATGNTGLLSTAVSQQTVAATDLSKVNPLAQMSAQYAGLWTTPTATIAGTINNLWACVKDLRNAPTVRSVTGLNTDNTDPLNPIVKISVDGTTITGLGTLASPLVNAGVTQIVAGTNVTISPVGGTGVVTINSTSGAGIFTHYIGELFGGGIVVSVWKDAGGVEHGLIASIENLDNSNTFLWTKPAYVTVACPGAASQNDGTTNTAAIVAQAGAGTTYAAGLCDVYAGGGFTDWYLPSIYELNAISNAATIINIILPTGNGPILGVCWSSTIGFTSDSDAFGKFPLTSVGAEYTKNSAFFVRAMRKF